MLPSLQMASSFVTLEKSECLLKLKSNSFSLRKFNGKSAVWKHFMEVIDSNSKEY